MKKFKALMFILIIMLLAVSCEQEEEGDIYGDYNSDSSGSQKDEDFRPDEFQTKPDADTIVVNDNK